ncbi:hypothetical protein EIP91_003965 [Steccherinum ochraceum]|uniref:Cytochrome P450-dit2 n=1 Tax=Steccherinum ochraceum TaxID=92696 RepID=A0A4R0RRB5_9APHY|nr:hypothetical protein EIP91_003965 [Steccherinum ochraceum]
MDVLIIAVLAILVVGVLLKSHRSRNPPLPPGPKPWPIIGNVLDMPTERPWDTYSEWCRQYKSDILYLRLPMQHAIILGTFKAATELFDKRSHTYSDRLNNVVLQLMRIDDILVVARYNAVWKAQRRIFHQYFGQSTVEQYREIQLHHARLFLTWVHETPADVRQHVRRWITSIIVLVTYGKTITGMNDEYVATAQKAVEGVSVASVPGVHWLNYFPLIRYIPSWVPGNASMKFVKEYGPIEIQVKDMPYNEAKAGVENGTAVPSIASALIEEIKTKYADTEEEPTQENIAKTATSTVYGAGTDTTTSSAEFFLLAMAMYPEVQRKAHAELDRVVGSTRLPDSDDLPQLPYLRAIFLEVLRWFPVTPFGVPHVNTAEDTYEGYHIPKDTLIIPFIPERYLDKNGEINKQAEEQVLAISFGFGRRYFAEEALSMYMATTLHALNITAGKDDDGHPVELRAEMGGALVSTPITVPRGFEPRSKAAMTLISDLQAGLELESASAF